MVQSFRNSLLLVLLALAAVSGVAPGDRREATVQDFNQALKAFPKGLAKVIYAEKKEVRGEKVRVSDYVFVDKKGTPVFHQNKHRSDEEFKKQIFLDCTTFASPLLHRMVKGEFKGFSQSDSNKYGSIVAAKYGLKESYSDSAANFIACAAKMEWRKANEGIYYFDLRRSSLGHVGFLVVSPNGIRHLQMTQTHGPGPLDKNGFGDYLKGTTYFKEENGTVTLFAVSIEVVDPEEK